MNTHPYIRAYLAGVFFPTLGLPVMLAGFLVLRFVFQVQFPIERGLVFPLALVPSVWGLWNMLWLALRASRPIPAGLHGAILPLLLLSHLVSELLRSLCADRAVLPGRDCRLLSCVEIRRGLPQPHARHRVSCPVFGAPSSRAERSRAEGPAF